MFFEQLSQIQPLVINSEGSSNRVPS
ncbi:hypothetical protein RDI58_016602 [Solanum bulbocastanum]|uniref:Uncharacterized protein n=1 Tax=Solanum bulbocastanum TaxID=147425 RepID=A0AAN8TN13_SOLBU